MVGDFHIDSVTDLHCVENKRVKKNKSVTAFSPPSWKPIMDSVREFGMNPTKQLFWSISNDAQAQYAKQRKYVMLLIINDLTLFRNFPRGFHYDSDTICGVHPIFRDRIIHNDMVEL